MNRVSYDDKGKLDEVVTDGGAHLMRLYRDHWILTLHRKDGSSFTAWLRGETTMTEELPAPKAGGDRITVVYAPGDIRTMTIAEYEAERLVAEQMREDDA